MRKFIFSIGLLFALSACEKEGQLTLVEGQVTNQAGTPIANYPVYLRISTFFSSNQEGFLADTAITDRNGRYKFQYLTSTNNNTRVYALGGTENNGEQVDDCTFSQRVEPGEKNQIDLQLSRPAANLTIQIQNIPGYWFRVTFLDFECDDAAKMFFFPTRQSNTWEMTYLATPGVTYTFRVEIFQNNIPIQSKTEVITLPEGGGVYQF
jgi:hypothetical protein